MIIAMIKQSYIQNPGVGDIIITRFVSNNEYRISNIEY